MSNLEVSKYEITLIAMIQRAIDLTVCNELNNLKHGRVERNFTTYLAQNIFTEFKRNDIRVDPFCNRHLGESKYLNGNLIELDIAVHTRDTDSNNLIAIELETVNISKRDDVWKVQDLTTRLDGYEYRLGLFLVIGIEDKAGQILTQEWYKNGEMILKLQ